MVKTINIDGKEVKFSTSFAWMLKYKSQFHLDPAKIIIPASQKANKDKSGLASLEEIGFVNIANMAWACAAICDNDIADPDTWVNSFEEFPIVSVATELLPALFASFSSKKK